MKKVIITIIILSLFFWAIIFFRYNNGEPVNTIKNSIEEKINNDIKELLVPTENTLQNEILKNVDIKVIDIKDDNLVIKINSPDISNDLLTWMKNISDEDYKDELFLEKIIDLINTEEKQESTIELSYSQINGDYQIDYTNEFAEVISCGLSRFYDMATEELIKELIEE